MEKHGEIVPFRAGLRQKRERGMFVGEAGDLPERTSILGMGTR
jgi:hypothetical protein